MLIRAVRFLSELSSCYWQFVSSGCSQRVLVSAKASLVGYSVNFSLINTLILYDFAAFILFFVFVPDLEISF